MAYSVEASHLIHMSKQIKKIYAQQTSGRLGRLTSIIEIRNGIQQINKWLKNIFNFLLQFQKVFLPQIFQLGLLRRVIK
jgi:hypothetical protein